MKVRVPRNQNAFMNPFFRTILCVTTIGLFLAAPLCAQPLNPFYETDAPSTVSLEERSDLLPLDMPPPTPAVLPQENASTIGQAIAPEPGPVVAPAGEQPPPLGNTDAELEESMSLPAIIGWAALGVLGVLIVLYIRHLWIGMDRRRRYQEVMMMEEQPSADERIMGELATLHVVLLRGSATGYYEKIHKITCRVLTNRGFLDPKTTSLATEKVVARLQAIGADPAFLELTESILSRCDSVVQSGEKPAQAANDKIARDLKTLVAMRASATADS